MEITISQIGWAVVGMGVLGAGLGYAAYRFARAWNSARGDDQERQRQEQADYIARQEMLISQYKSLYEAALAKIEALKADVAELRLQVESLRRQVNESEERNHILQSLICKWRSQCPFADAALPPKAA